MEARPDTWRLFVGMEVPENVRETLAEAQAGLKKELAALPIRWTSSDQLHLTLRFLGDVDAAQSSGLSSALGGVSRQFAPIRMQATGLGFFPNVHRPRVLWAGLADPLGLLGKLAHAVGGATDPFTSQPPVERFHPHFTLGRLRELHRSQLELLTRCVSKVKIPAVSWNAAEMVLMRSQLSCSGPHYSIVHRHRLSGHCA